MRTFPSHGGAATPTIRDDALSLRARPGMLRSSGSRRASEHGLEGIAREVPFEAYTAPLGTGWWIALQLPADVLAMHLHQSENTLTDIDALIDATLLPVMMRQLLSEARGHAVRRAIVGSSACCRCVTPVASGVDRRFQL